MKKHCPVPFSELRINANGYCYLCCPQWNGKKSIGNVFTTPDLDEIWNSAVAREIRESMFDGSYRFCDLSLCQVKKDRHVDSYKSSYLETGPKFLALNYDETCNLQCVMCRKEKLVIRKDKQEKLIAFQERLVESRYFKDARMINCSSSGDPFASKVFWHLFEMLDDKRFPNLRMRVRTHGLGLTPRNWERMRNIHGIVKQIWISIDAATAETYDKIRLGGDFSLLKENLTFLQSIKEQFGFQLALHFIVQKDNFHEIPAFIEFAKSYDADLIWFAQVYQGSALTYPEFIETAVHNPEHPLHGEFLRVMQDPLVYDPTIDWTNLIQFVGGNSFARKEGGILQRSALQILQ